MSTQEQGLSKPFLRGQTNYICAVKRASYFSPDKTGWQRNLLSVEVNCKGLFENSLPLVSFLLYFLLHIRPHETLLAGTTEAYSSQWAEGAGGPMLLKLVFRPVHNPFQPIIPNMQFTLFWPSVTEAFRCIWCLSVRVSTLLLSSLGSGVRARRKIWPMCKEP